MAGKRVNKEGPTGDTCSGDSPGQEVKVNLHRGDTDNTKGTLAGGGVNKGGSMCSVGMGGVRSHLSVEAQLWDEPGAPHRHLQDLGRPVPVVVVGVVLPDLLLFDGAQAVQEVVVRWGSGLLLQDHVSGAR